MLKDGQFNILLMIKIYKHNILIQNQREIILKVYELNPKNSKKLYLLMRLKLFSDTTDDEKKEALNFDIFQIIKPRKPYKGAKTQESRESASKILEILKLRDYYSFDGHEYSEISSKFIQHNAKKEPYIIWNIRMEVLSNLENMKYFKKIEEFLQKQMIILMLQFCSLWLKNWVGYILKFIDQENYYFNNVQLDAKHIRVS